MRGGGQPDLKLKCAFTLAEVLITLGIIGIVAAMTLPSLIQKNHDKEIIVRVRKLYSDISNAAMKAQADSGVIGDNSVLFNPNQTHAETAKKLVKYFNGAKFCQSSNQKGCYNYYYDIKYAQFYTNDASTGGKWTAGDGWLPAIILNNGGIVYVHQRNNPDCYAEESYTVRDEYGYPILDENGKEQVRTSYVSICSVITFDVNGKKLPNRFGQDVQQVIIYKDKITPSYQKHTGSESIKGILSGSDKFIYSDYSVGAEQGK